MSTTSPDTIDLGDVARSIARGWRTILASVGVCLLFALLVILFGPRRFDGTASAVVRASDGGSSLLARIGSDVMSGGGSANGGGQGVGGGIGAILGGASSPLETEIQILASNSVLGAVVDSLLLQVVPRSDQALPATAFVSAVRLPGSFRRMDLKAERTSSGQYHVVGDNVDATVSPGGNVVTPVGSIALRSTLPPRFSLRLRDRDDAIKAVAKQFSVKKAGGEVLKVTFRSPDSITAAAVPNAALVTYLARKKTSDRGVNAHRVEFLAAQLDSTARELSAAEASLRRFQERSGLLDPEVMGKIELEEAAGLRKNLGEIEVEEGALDQMLAQVAAGTITVRQLGAYPSFLRNPAINDLLRRITELETERTRLLERRLENDEEVQTLTRSIANTEAQLVPIGKTYASSLKRQRAEIERQLRSTGAVLGSFPSNAESSVRLTREVKRLGLTYSALQTQLVQARLNAIAEGGDVRALDVATIPKKVAFPEPVLTAGVGLGVGLAMGLLLALLSGSHGRYLEDPHAIERAVGVPALRFDPRTPLLMSGRTSIRTILLIPVDEAVMTARVAERLADTALARGESATILDLTSRTAAAPLGASVGEMISRLEQDHGMVIVRLPGLSSDSTAAALSEVRPVLLVAPSKRIHRRELVGAMDTLRRLNVPCAGVVLSEAEPKGVVAG